MVLGGLAGLDPRRAVGLTGSGVYGRGSEELIVGCVMSRTDHGWCVQARTLRLSRLLKCAACAGAALLAFAGGWLAVWHTAPSHWGLRYRGRGATHAAQICRAPLFTLSICTTGGASGALKRSPGQTSSCTGQDCRCILKLTLALPSLTGELLEISFEGGEVN